VIGKHQSAAARHRRRLALVLAITSTIFVVEVVLASGSLGLLADAGHVLTDVAGIALSLLAIWFASRPATAVRSFRYLRPEILSPAGDPRRGRQRGPAVRDGWPRPG
jgi:cobalt-zinc-cadmium efflux system protein